MNYKTIAKTEKKTNRKIFFSFNFDNIMDLQTMWCFVYNIFVNYIHLPPLPTDIALSTEHSPEVLPTGHSVGAHTNMLESNSMEAPNSPTHLGGHILNIFIVSQFLIIPYFKRLSTINRIMQF